jgi:hypothetical protein
MRNNATIIAAAIFDKSARRSGVFAGAPECT